MKHTIHIKRAVALLCLCLVLVGYGKATPDSGEPAAPLAEVLDAMTLAITCYDDISERYSGALDAVQAFIDANGTDSSAIVAVIDDTIEYLDNAAIPPNTLESKEDQFRKIGLSYLDFEAAFNYLPIARQDYKERLNVIKWYLTEYVLYDRNALLKTNIEMDKAVLKNEIIIQYIGLNWFLLNIDEDIAANYRDTVLAKLPGYQREALAWQGNKAVLEEWVNTAFDNIEAALVEYEWSINKLQNELDTQEQLYRIEEKEAILKESKRELEEASRKLEEAKQRGRDTFQPELSDDFAILWNKALRFHSLKDEEYVTLCLNTFIAKAQTASDAYFTVESAQKIADAAEAFWKEAREGKREGGVMALYFDPPDGHAFLRMADIIIKINGVPCNELEDYIENKQAEAPNTLTYLRLENGILNEYEDSVPAGDTVKIAGGDLIEYFEIENVD